MTVAQLVGACKRTEKVRSTSQNADEYKQLPVVANQIFFLIFPKSNNSNKSQQRNGTLPTLNN